MKDPNSARTCFDVVHDVLADVAPEEIRFLPEVWEVYRRAPAKRRSRDRTLGAGIPKHAESWTSIVVSVVGSSLFESLSSPSPNSRQQDAVPRSGRLRDLFVRQPPPEPLAPAVDPDQRAKLVADIQAKALATGIGADRTDALVAAVERRWIDPATNADQPPSQ